MFISRKTKTAGKYLQCLKEIEVEEYVESILYNCKFDGAHISMFPVAIHNGR